MAFVNILMENFSLLAAKRMFTLSMTVKQIAQLPIGALDIITAIIAAYSYHHHNRSALAQMVTTLMTNLTKQWQKPLMILLHTIGVVIHAMQNT